jgi:hypothetical protein
MAIGFIGDYRSILKVDAYGSTEDYHGSQCSEGVLRSVGVFVCTPAISLDGQRGTVCREVLPRRVPRTWQRKVVYNGIPTADKRSSGTLKPNYC